MSAYNYGRYIGLVTRFPWAITPDTRAAIRELLVERAAGSRPTDQEIAARLGDGARKSPHAASSGAVAVIPYIVNQRTREFGIRMAIGADRRHGIVDRVSH